ncbi:MAG: hypothetical protein MRZ86_02060, partial [Acidaminococcus sp.]|nr:hypothetical protein [Acidaminococcus sp.]
EADCKRRQTPLANVCRATHTKTMWLSNAKPRLQPKLQSKKRAILANHGRGRLQAKANAACEREPSDAGRDHVA